MCYLANYSLSRLSSLQPEVPAAVYMYWCRRCREWRVCARVRRISLRSRCARSMFQVISSHLYFVWRNWGHIPPSGPVRSCYPARYLRLCAIARIFAVHHRVCNLIWPTVVFRARLGLLFADKPTSQEKFPGTIYNRFSTDNQSDMLDISFLLSWWKHQLRSNPPTNGDLVGRPIEVVHDE